MKSVSQPTLEIPLDLTVVVTQIQGMRRLWKNCAEPMRKAVSLHDEFMRENVEAFGGQVSREARGSFLMAFDDTLDAVRWSLFVQEALLNLEWPEELSMFDDAASGIDAAGAWLWRGLRVRMGMHSGSSVSTDYPGRAVDRAIRITAAAHGGQVLMTQRVWQVVAPSAHLLHDPSIRQLGKITLKGTRDRCNVFQALPGPLAEREYPALRESGTRVRSSML